MSSTTNSSSGPVLTAERTSDGDQSDQSDILPSSCDVPWREGFRIGSGIDSLTGAVAATAVQVIDTPQFDEYLLQKQYIDISSELDTVHRVTPFIRDTPLLSLEPLSIRAWSMARAIALAEPFEHSLSFLLWSYNETSYIGPRPVDTLSELPMTPGAKELWESSAAQFREKYGDYFVAYASTGSEHSVLVTMVYDHDNDYTAVREKVAKALPVSDSGLGATLDDRITDDIDGVLGPSFGSARLLIRFFDRATSYYSEYETRERVFDVPVHAQLQVLKVIREYWASAPSQPITVQLHHYSKVVESGYRGRAVPLDTRAVAEQRELQIALERCSVAATALPERLIDDPSIIALRDKQRYDLEQCLAERTSLSSSKISGPQSKRRRWIEKFRRTEEEINDFLAIFKFWTELAQKRVQEPVETVDVNSGSIRLWSYGVSETPITAIRITKESVRAQSRAPMGFPSSRSKIVSFDAPVGTYIVGWRVENTNGVGSWRRDSDAVILQQEAQFTIYPGLAQSSAWSFTFFCAEHEYLSVFAKHYGVDLGKHTARARLTEQT